MLGWNFRVTPTATNNELLFSMQVCLSPGLFLPNIVGALTPTVGGTFVAATFTLHTWEKARFHRLIPILSSCAYVQSTWLRIKGIVIQPKRALTSFLPIVPQLCAHGTLKLPIHRHMYFFVTICAEVCARAKQFVTGPTLHKHCLIKNRCNKKKSVCICSGSLSVLRARIEKKSFGVCPLALKVGQNFLHTAEWTLEFPNVEEESNIEDGNVF